MTDGRAVVITPYPLEHEGQPVYGRLLGPEVRYLSLHLHAEILDGTDGGRSPTGAWSATDHSNVLHVVYSVPGMALAAPDDAPVLGAPCLVRPTGTPGTAGWQCLAHGHSGVTRPGTDLFVTGPVQCFAARLAVQPNTNR